MQINPKNPLKPNPMERNEHTRDDIEVRSYQSGLRSSDPEGGRTVTGYAALFNSTTHLGGKVYERIAPGAFKKALTRSDIKLLKNHKESEILGRTGVNLTVSEDDKGLPVECEFPDTTMGRDCLTEVRMGLIDQMSFAFTIGDETKEERSDGTVLFTITEVREIYDVSIVTYPAYKDTNVTVSKSRQRSRSIIPDIIQPESPTASTQYDDIMKLVEAGSII